MLRETELITEPGQDPTWKRIDRLMPEAAGMDGDAVLAALVGAAAAVLAVVLAT